MRSLYKYRQFNAPEPSFMKFAVNYASVPSTPVITTPKIKYGKLSFVSQELDDSSRGWEPMLEFFKTLYYTDGCGNNIPFTAALAVNCGFGIPGDPGYNPAITSVAEMRTLTDAGWDIENHGMYHGSNTSSDADVQQLNDLLLLRMQYQARGIVVPTNFTGYAHSGYTRGYIFTTAQSDLTFDEFQSVRVHKVLPPLNTNPIYICMTRDFIDTWDDVDTNYLYPELDSLLNGARDFIRIGTHSILNTDALLNGFKAIYNKIHTMSEDRILVCTTREFLEYREMCNLPRTQVLNSNRLEVTIDMTGLSPLNRWRDISMNITSDKQIQSVEILEGADSYSFNASTGLVNLFSQKTIW